MGRCRPRGLALAGQPFSAEQSGERAPPCQGMGRLLHAAAGLGVGPGRLPGLRHSLKQEHRWHRGPFYPEDLQFPPLLGKGLVGPSCCTAEGLCVSAGARAGFGAARLGLSPASGGVGAADEMHLSRE